MVVLTGPKIVAMIKKNKTLKNREFPSPYQERVRLARMTIREYRQMRKVVNREYNRLFLIMTPISNRSYLKRPTAKTTRGIKLNVPNGKTGYPGIGRTLNPFNTPIMAKPAHKYFSLFFWMLLFS